MENDEDEKIAIQKKGWRTREYTSCEGRRLRAALTLFSSIPLDFLWRRVQHLEVRGAVLQDLCWPPTNCYLQACHEYLQMLSGDATLGPFGPFLWCFGRAGEAGHTERIGEIRATTLHQVAHLWWRLVVPSLMYPYSLCVLVDARHTEAKKLDVAQGVYGCRDCLDPEFTLKVFTGNLPPGSSERVPFRQCRRDSISPHPGTRILYRSASASLGLRLCSRACR